MVLDPDLRVVTVSRSFYDVFKVKPEETMGKLIYDLGNKQWDIPKLRELLEDILPKKATFDDYEVEHDFLGIGRRTMLLNARQIERGMGKERIILLAIADVFDALTSKRPYKEPFSVEDSLAIIGEGRGSHFDPDVVDAFFAIQDEILTIKKEYDDNNQQASDIPELKALSQQYS
jgi:PAS domain-containing protein